ncbi:MAG: sarcosine oxidase subunit alpha family protein [Rhodobacteraceae bacterium]|nr:MAG: sarcosine oxidase subunit alpha family protein [Paracoccaceae bacterium]
MAHRLPAGGRLIDRAKPLSFRFDGAPLTGFAGDTLAAALLANDRVMVGRSFKYHRPRGVVGYGAEEPNALMGLGEGARFEPNARATTTELFEGLTARSQNCWPSLAFDVGAVNAAVASVAPVFPAGFYYKTFIQPRAAWKHVFEPVIRAAAGLGKPPREADEDVYEHMHLYVDVLVAGGGLAGLAAARAAAEAGARVLLAEQTPHLGGRALSDDDTAIGGEPAADWAGREAAALAEAPNVTVLTRAMVAGLYDHGFALVLERVADHEPGRGRKPRHRLWKVRAKRIVVAAGSVERPLAFACNDVPGVMLAAAARDYLALHAVAPGRRIAVFAAHDDAYRTALAAQAAGLEATVIDPREDAGGPLAAKAAEMGVPVRRGCGVARALGGKRVEGVEIARLRATGRAGGAPETLEVDAVAMGGGWTPVVHLWSHVGGKLVWDAAQNLFRPDAKRPPLGADGRPNVLCAGAANGTPTTAGALAEGFAAGAEAARACGFEAATPDAPAVEESEMAAPKALWFTPGRGKYATGTKHFVDFQNDVTAADVELAAREGYESVEHAKRYTTLGMATDQGKLSNINGLAILADALNAPIPQVGTTTFRPPYQPISLAAIAGRAAGPLFKPIRKTPVHGWHEAHGAAWEPVGDWRRPYCYPKAGETKHDAINREIRAVREAAGLLDASTLGKIVVKGPDAGAFLDLMYTNVLSSLAPGRCRYALMCNDNGFLFDDGVVARLSEDAFLCHTTSGGSDRVHAWMEEWLQTEWPHLKVLTANVTEQWAQFALAGPKAREILQALDGDIDFDREAFRFFDMKEGRLAGAPVRIYRISFSGELSYEIATPAGYGLALWEALMAAGAAHGIAPYGTEALHVLRAEKGFIAIGDETDGTVIPQDLGLGWAVSKKKADFVGKRAQARSWLTRDDRKQLVGLLTEDPALVLPDGAQAVESLNAKPPTASLGHVTSTYWSPTLNRSIAMALIKGGRARMGETVMISTEGATLVPCRVVDPVFFDKEGARQNV